ncbi:MAG: hypothetical protein AMXMBFR84_14340 [Candidatus Hydrogenedentota bacterium]
MKGKTVLLTGATGIMGSWVLGEALAKGVRPVVIMRDENPQRAQDRIDAVLRLIGKEQYRDRVRVVKGDASRPNFGLASALVDEFRSTLDAVLHCAASTSFNPSDDSDIWATNVEGVSHVLNFVRGTDITLYHVSTAYIAGTYPGLSHEDVLDRQQEFNNTYERSKFESEGMVRRGLKNGDFQGAIFRPAIIVGATDTGKISDFMNFYGFLRMADLASTRKGTGNTIVRVEASPDVRVNLVPVDWTAKALWHIIEAEGASGHAYHLTNPNAHPVGELKDWVNTLIHDQGLRFELVDRLDDATTTLENIAHNAFRHYRCYLKQQPDFDRTNTDRALNGTLPFPEIGPDTYSVLLDYARSQRWKGIFANSKVSANGHTGSGRRISTDYTPAAAVAN